MPLLDISANIAGLDSPSRKRSHEDFVGIPCHEMVQSRLSFGAAVRTQNPPAEPQASQAQTSSTKAASPAPDNTPARNSPSLNHTPSRPTAASSTLSSTPPPAATMASAAAVTPAAAPFPAVAASPVTDSTPAIPPSSKPPTKTPATPSSVEPPAKRKRLTASEKEDKAKADELKRQQREQEKAEKAAEKAKHDEEKKAKAEEARKKREEKEEEARKKQEDKERKRREKEEEQRKLQEAKDKKEQSQMRLGAFFRIGPSTPGKAAAPPSKAATPSNTASPSGTPQKAAPGVGPSPPTDAAPDSLSEYRKIFKPFFLRENVKLASNAFELDEPARLAKSNALDSYVLGEKTFEPLPLTGAACVDYFCLAGLPKPRGRPYPSVRKIMSIMSDASAGSAALPIDLASESGTQVLSQATTSARELLKEVPLKYLYFFQDVRPAYCGTVTSTSPSSGSLHKLARNPICRDVLPLQYDYDSEAEWVDDGDGEDIDDLDDDDEDHGDEDEDMADFLDDSEDVIKRPVFASGMEPESSGLCFEDRTRLGPSDQMYKYRLEFILDLDRHHGIDPLATHYWEPEAKPAPAPASLHPSTAAGMKPPPPASSTPTNAFTAISQGGAASSAAKKLPLVPADSVDDFKRAILKYPKLSKVGLVEVLSSEFDKCTKAQVKNSVEAMAERSGTGHDKMWKLRPDHAL